MEPTTPPTAQDDPLRFENNLGFLKFIHQGGEHAAGKAGMQTDAVVGAAAEYHPSWSIDGPDLHMFRTLARFNVEHNYLGYVLPLEAKGKQPRNEGQEDHWLVAALVVETNDAKERTSSNYVYSRPAYKEAGGCLKLEDLLIKLAEHYKEQAA